MKLRLSVLTCTLIASGFVAYGQNSVGIGIANPNKNAVLELISPTHNQGLLIPKLTTAQRTATAFISLLTDKENGLMVFDSDEKRFYYWEVSAWKAMGTGSELLGGDGVSIVNNTISTIPQDLEIVGSTLTVTNNATAVPIDLSSLNIPQDLQLSGSTLTITNNTAATPINLSAFTGTNTDEQILNFDGATGNLSISRITGGPQTVNIPIPTTTPPSGTASGDLTGNYPNPTVANNAITSAKIADGTVASADILDGTVASADIADNTVASADILDGTVASVDIADGTIVSADILDGTVTTADITDNTITTGDINDGTIASIDIGALQVTNAHIATGVAVAKLAPGTNGQFLQTTTGATTWGPAPTATGTASGDLTGNYPNPTVANDAITSAKIANLTIANGDIATNAGIDVTKVAPGTNGQFLQTTTGATTWGPPPSASGTAGGDLTGSFPNPQIAALTIVDGDISATAGITVSKLGASASNGFVLTSSAGVSQWAAPGASPLISAPGTRNLVAGSPLAGTSGTDNTTYGSSAGNAAITGNFNVYIGSGAGRNTADGTLNTMIGWHAGNATATPLASNGNTFVGAEAGLLTTDGPNTFIGEKAGWNNNQGTHSVMVGNRAGVINTLGFQNTIVGSLANLSANNLNNATAIGYNTVVDASNKVRIGNAAVTVIQGQVAFTAASDRRLKSNIEPFKNGLDLVMKLKPVSYNMKNSTDTRTNWGFIAQDIESLVGTNNAVLTVSGDKERTLGLRYTDFVAPLVKAVQEQQDQISDLNNKLSENEKKMELLMAEIETLKKAVGLKAENK